jgi:hypothetical protein
MMHLISDASLKRPGYIYQRTPGGGFAGYPVDFRPATINWKHIDGPLLHTTDGGLHWMTWRERIQFFCGWIDINDLDMKHHRQPVSRPDESSR